ncbi:PucR family transcriptional regulator [Metabacillus iocasae]|uniref:DNA-binding PucR family transcriptional regulator n=1 Tax=Priestia iocasae TaxID=2291674 RepID=A0ABS2QVE0_9BACI|nr:helix-turn-helix domain-containing protein [Metabacillus iocasae]MBM7702706.1 DNA-binding PucR family transcriptional regulator [Metabacillus iocasae]
MIDKLQRYFGSSMVLGQTPHEFNEYKWFLTTEHEFVGVKYDDLSEEALELLSIFLTPYEATHQSLSVEEAYWYDLLFRNQKETIQSLDSYSFIRFIQFNLQRPLQEKAELEDALKSLYSTDVVIIWEHETSGVIIEKLISINDKDENLQDTVDVLTSDFGSTIQFFEGQLYDFPLSLSTSFQLERAWFQQLKKMVTHQKIIKPTSFLPYLIMKDVPNPLKEQLKQVLKFVEQDKELIQTVKVYLECNLNVSLASKKLYMHRNSLQYRIDKFIDRTNLDIKDFQGALSAYLAILANELDESEA